MTKDDLEHADAALRLLKSQIDANAFVRTLMIFITDIMIDDFENRDIPDDLRSDLSNFSEAITDFLKSTSN